MEYGFSCAPVVVGVLYDNLLLDIHSQTFKGKVQHRFYQIIKLTRYKVLSKTYKYQPSREIITSEVLSSERKARTVNANLPKKRCHRKNIKNI